MTQREKLAGYLATIDEVSIGCGEMFFFFWWNFGGWIYHHHVPEVAGTKVCCLSWNLFSFTWFLIRIQPDGTIHRHKIEKELTILRTCYCLFDVHVPFSNITSFQKSCFQNGGFIFWTPVVCSDSVIFWEGTSNVKPWILVSLTWCFWSVLDPRMIHKTKDLKFKV